MMAVTGAALDDVRYLVDEQGHAVAAVVDIRVWEGLLDRLEDAEDARLARERLANWPSKSGWTPWADFEAELDRP